jgi:hypothetical protein
LLLSPRLELASLALGAALATRGVVCGNAGTRGVYVTRADDALLTGVVAVAEPGGRYSIDLFLTAALVPLHPLATRVRKAVAAAAAGAGLGERLGALSVSFLDVQEPPAERPRTTRVPKLS